MDATCTSTDLSNGRPTPAAHTGQPGLKRHGDLNAYSSSCDLSPEFS